jgi:hypothetical protein
MYLPFSESLMDIKNEIRNLSAQVCTRTAAKQDTFKSKELRSLEGGTGGVKLEDQHLATLQNSLEAAKKTEKILLSDLEATTSWATQMLKVVALYAADPPLPMVGLVPGLSRF